MRMLSSAGQAGRRRRYFIMMPAHRRPRAL